MHLILIADRTDSVDYTVIGSTIIVVIGRMGIEIQNKFTDVDIFI